MEQKAEANEMIALLDRKADIAEVADQFSEVIRVLDGKADTRLVEDQLNLKANATELAILLDRKADRDDMLANLAAKANAADVQRATRHLDSKANIVDVNALLEQVARSIENLSADLHLKADAQDVVSELDKKLDVAELQGLLALKANVTDVNEALNAKANKEAVVSALQLKANAADVETSLALKASVTDVNGALARKADVEAVRSELERKTTMPAVLEEVELRIANLNKAIMHEIYGRPSTVDIEQKLQHTDQLLAHLSDLIGTKALETDLHALKRDLAATKHELANKLSARVNEVQMNSALERLALELRQEARSVAVETGAALQAKVSNAQLSDALRETLASAASAAAAERAVERAHLLDEVGSRLQSALATKAARRDIDDILEKLERLREACIAELEGKVDIGRFDDAVVNLNEAINKELMNMTGVLNVKVDHTTLNAALRSALDSFEVAVASTIRDQIDAALAVCERGIDATANELRSETEAALSEKANTREVAGALNDKADASRLAELREAIFGSGKQLVTSDVLDEVRREVKLKASVADVMTLLDAKCDVTEVNGALAQVTAELDTKAPAAEVQRISSAQTRALESYAAEMIVGRWLWKSGRTKGGHGVPWNVQTVNSAPDNFLWEKDKVTIVTVLPGLYEISFGFFSRVKPTIMVLVDGQPVMSCVNSSSYVLHHSSGRVGAVDDHPSGNVTGLTLIDFLALPPRARLAISYKGEEMGEGFLALRKL